MPVGQVFSARSSTLFTRRGSTSPQKETTARLVRLREVVLPTLGARIGQVDRIDLRYTNGFAIAWAGPSAEAGSRDG